MIKRILNYRMATVLNEVQLKNELTSLFRNSVHIICNMSRDIQLNNWLGNRLFGSFKKITIGNTYIWINTQRERDREREREVFILHSSLTTTNNCTVCEYCFCYISLELFEFFKYNVLDLMVNYFQGCPRNV